MERKNNIRLLLIICIVTVVVFIPSFQNEFTNYDDNRLIVDNHLIREFSAQNMKAWFTEYYDYIYQPVTLFSWALDYKIAGYNTWIYHFNNLLFHLANTILVFLLVRRLFRQKLMAFTVASLFGIHTLHVESVAWMSERKDVLYAFFFLASLLCYLKYLDRQKITWILVSLLAFLLSLGVKGQAVSLAATLIAVDLLLERKLLDREVIFEKLPFFAIAVIFGLLAMQGHESAGTLDEKALGYSYAERIAFGSYALVQYVLKLIVPYDLSAFYPYPERVEGSIPFYYKLFIIPVVMMAGLLVYLLKKKKLKAAFAILFFIINVALVLKIFKVQIGIFIMADRYTYIPSIGIFILLALLIAWLTGRYAKQKKLLISVFVLYLLIIAALSFQRNKIWKDSLTLWDDVLKKHPDSPWVLNMKGMALAEKKEYKKAIETYNKAISIDPKRYIAYYNRGNIYQKLNRLEMAYKDYEKTISLEPGFAKAYLNKGSVLTKIEKFDEALMAFNSAIKADSAYAEAYFNRAYLLLMSGRKQDALKNFDLCLQYDPYFSPAYHNRAVLKMELNDFNGALADLDKAVKYSLANAMTYFFRGDCKMMLNDKNGACSDWRKSAELGNKKVMEKLMRYCN